MTKTRTRATPLTLVCVSIILAGCGAADDDSTFAVRVARALSQSLVDAATESDTSSDDESRETPSEPLALASSRPDSILDQRPSDALGSYQERTLSAAVPPTLTFDENVQADVTGHVIRATVFTDYARKCQESSRTRIRIGDFERQTETSGTDCPISRRRSGNLTRI